MPSARTRTLSIAAVLALALALVIPAAAFADDASSQLTTGTITLSDAQATVSYAAHIRGGSWLPQAENGAQAGKSSPVDALKMSVSANVSGSIQYQVYVAGKGWQKVRADGVSIGKLGKKYGIEAVRVALTGDLSKYYNVTYTVKPKKSSWQTWKKNGAVVGKAGSGKPITAFKVKLVKKSGETTSGEGLLNVRYRVRMQNKKWQVWQANNATAGKNNSKSQVYGFALALDKGTYSGSICYRVRPENGSWKAWKKNGASTGSSSKIEAIQIKLTGSLAKKYDVVYRVNIKGVGWQKRVRNGETAGTTSRGARIRSIRVQLVDKSKRTGWVGSGNNWKYYKSGRVLKSQWVITKESPIDELQGGNADALYYWVDSSGKLALDRIVDPSKSRDAGAGFKAYATRWGYIMLSGVKQIGKTWYVSNSKGVLTLITKKKRDTLIEMYVQWALDIADDSSHGYSQANRWGPDYDCSSLVVSALQNAGFDTGDAVWTGNMKSELTKHGFRWYTDFSKLKRGDILLVHSSSRQHTEIYIGKGKTVGAHIAETGGVTGKAGDQTGNEISVGPYYKIWQGYLRFAG